MPNLLLVDDEPVVLDVLRRILEQPGRTIFTAPGTDEAMRHAGSHPIDVAVIDKNLLGASGLDLARSLKRVQPEVELILLTGYASIDSAIEAVQIGAFDYLTKPVDDYAVLRRKIQLAEERAAMRRAQRTLIAQIAESEQRFRRLVESAPDALLLCDVETGRILDANPAAARTYRLSPDQLLALKEGDVRGSPVASASELSWEIHKRGDGDMFDAEVRATEITYDGRPVRALSVRDVTDKQRMEREQRELQERLRLSQKMEAVGRLAGGVAHDFNNLLAVMHAHADFLFLQLPEGHEARAEADGILRAAQRGAALTKQLLLFSRHKPLDLSPLDVNEVVRDTARLLSRVLGESIHLIADLQPELWPVRADPDQLAQVILNLAVNARDAMPSGGELRVRTVNTELQQRRSVRGAELAPGRYVELSVRDEGTGMSADVLARLFEPFFTTKEQGKGTGLGLATIYGIVQASRGVVEVQSELGKGSTFSVWLPAVEEAGADSVLGATQLARGKGETVLVVEDEAPLRAVLRRMLGSNGYSVLEAPNGRDALDAARAHAGTIQLLLTDIVMPGMDGRTLALELGRERAGLRVLYMSGYTDRPLPESGTNLGFIQKPFQTHALLAQMRKLLDS